MVRRIRAPIVGAAAMACGLLCLGLAGCGTLDPDSPAAWTARPRANSLVHEDGDRWRHMVHDQGAPPVAGSVSDEDKSR